MIMAKVNKKWLINLNKVKYVGISNDANNKIEVKFDDDEKSHF